jgi:hypothetical protein
MYKFIIQILKEKKQNIFWVFLKYLPSSHSFNKLVIKAKMHAKTYIYIYIYIQCDDFFSYL